MVHGSFAKKEASLREQLAAAEQQAAHWQVQIGHQTDVDVVNQVRSDLVSVSRTDD